MANTYTQLYIHIVFAVKSRPISHSKTPQSRTSQIYYRHHHQQKTDCDSNQFNARPHPYPCRYSSKRCSLKTCWKSSRQAPQNLSTINDGLPGSLNGKRDLVPSPTHSLMLIRWLPTLGARKSIMNTERSKRNTSRF